MKTLAFLLLTASAYAGNANLSFDRDRDLQEMILLEYNGHFYEIDRIEHSWHCPCVKDSDGYYGKITGIQQ